jgi:hypothetical protein
VPLLQTQGQLRRLQGHRYFAEAFDKPRQNLFAKTQRQLCRLPEESPESDKARQIYGAAALYELIKNFETAGSFTGIVILSGCINDGNCFWRSRYESFTC